PPGFSRSAELRESVVRPRVIDARKVGRGASRMAACLRTPTMPSMSDLHSRNQTTLLEGQLASVGLADLIQLVCLGAQSVRIHLLHPARGALGSVTVLDGAVVDAEVDGHRGEPALFRLMGVDDGGFRVNALEERARVSTSIARHWQELLLEAAR